MTEQPFPITQELRQQAVDTLMNIIENGEPENQIEACRVLCEMDRLNVDCESRDRPSWN
jgi:hypothetical protein